MASNNRADKFFNFENSVKNFITKFSVYYSRKLAHRSRKAVVKYKGGESVVNRKMKKTIKDHCKKRFGTSAYWPFLAFYTEIRGHFVEGWIPYDYFRYRVMPKINPRHSIEISEQKTFDHRLFGDFVVKPLLVFISGMYMDADYKNMTKSEVDKYLAEYNDTIVVKEERGCKGMQIRIIHSSEFKHEMINTKINYIIQPFVKQYKTISELYPESINTFRVVTYLNKDGSISIKFAILRFGIDGANVDNISSGGQYLFFDADGKPSSVAYNGMGFSVGEKHKNTGFTFADLSVPMYPEVIEQCKIAHRKYPYVQLIGWDVCVDESGEPKLIEWNADNPEIKRYEAKFGPFWSEDDDIYKL